LGQVVPLLKHRPTFVGSERGGAVLAVMARVARRVLRVIIN
jgi:hypothetical protein